MEQLIVYRYAIIKFIKNFTSPSLLMSWDLPHLYERLGLIFLFIKIAVRVSFIKHSFLTFPKFPFRGVLQRKQSNAGKSCTSNAFSLVSCQAGRQNAKAAFFLLVPAHFFHPFPLFFHVRIKILHYCKDYNLRESHVISDL